LRILAAEVDDEDRPVLRAVLRLRAVLTLRTVLSLRTGKLEDLRRLSDDSSAPLS
jgi:hypothetical protein